MIPISQATIDTYIAQQKREKMDYIRKLIDLVKQENPLLFKKLIDGALEFAAMAVEKRKSKKVSDDDFAREVQMNIILYALSVYHCINIQLEVNELEKTYGES